MHTPTFGSGRTVAITQGTIVCDPNEPDIIGVVIEHPAVDPEGQAHDDLATVRWTRRGEPSFNDLEEVSTLTAW